MPITRLLLLGVCLPLCAHAQTGSNGVVHPVTFRMLTLGSSAPEIYYEYRDKPVRISAGNTAFSSPQRAIPGQDTVIYRQIPPTEPDGVPHKETLDSFRLSEGGPYLVFMQINPENRFDIRTFVVDDNWQEHPAGTMRIFNFSRHKAVAKSGDKIVELAPSQSALFRYAEKKQTWLQVAVQETEKWVLRTSSPQVTPPGTRSVVVILDQPTSEERPETRELLLRNFLEQVPALGTAQ